MKNNNIKGADDFLAKVKTMKAEYLKGAEKIIAQTVLEVNNDTTTKLQSGARSGRIYKRGKGRYHQASAIGEYPKTDRGILVASLFFLVKKTANLVTGEFGSKAAHGKHLEFKPVTQGGRPWLKPQFDLFAERLKKKLSDFNKDILSRIWSK